MTLESLLQHRAFYYEAFPVQLDGPHLSNCGVDRACAKQMLRIHRCGYGDGDDDLDCSIDAFLLSTNDAGLALRVRSHCKS